MSHPIPHTDLKALRKKLGLTQKEFAKKYHIPLDSITSWEQRRIEPTHATKLLLILIDEIPEQIETIIKKYENI